MGDSSRRRSRSRSPTQRGFRWKKKPASRYDDKDDDVSSSKYRERSPRRDYRRHDNRSNPRFRQDRDSNSATPSSSLTSKTNKEDQDKVERENDKPPKKSAVASEPLLIVHVNDRLGSKTAVPCLGSDKIHQLKALVAARIGRPPSSIILRRQGERPFKDQLTLADYGISSGVQLDLEIDTSG
ncbi:ubiquitin-related domain-containing protein [Xylogone sp. PMI_703]|nr:ubiquitin-related domain-containing protein [Xylogone sp. PMI_703]